ncbi:hypothetical protein SAMN05216464_11081 [Mucilaginibacter pineti]|uniref:Uncharacterized protein n=1 Tax=Mucilaginibacter pineti TaxID=1391627 RepID=A0A1G7GCR1_9SPHI|nr:hypothetical protein [Mucilaginibacter pineti]SDE85881.1 hypothetical protein SAMN05216464_11081 [Mucilaginibacter pineti]
MKKVLTLLVVMVAFAASTFASPHKIDSKLATVSKLKKFQVPQNYYYGFMTTCGQTVYMTTNYKMSDAQFLVFSTAFDYVICTLAEN